MDDERSKPHSTQRAPYLTRRATKRIALIALAVLLISALHIWLRWPATHLPHFHNEDTAGITYSADLLLRGGIPLRDTAEMKAPGAFFVLASWWSLVGRGVESAQVLGALWAWLAALGVGVGAWWFFRSLLSAVLGALLYVALSPYTDSVDINYGAWMITPYLWSMALLWRALSRRGSALSSWLIVGLMMTCAALLKRQGAALAPLIALAGLISGGAWSARLKRIGAAALGSALGFVPICAWYASQGALKDFVMSYALSSSGWDYVRGGGVSALSSGERWARIGDGVMGLWVYSRAPLSLALSGTLITVMIMTLTRKDHKKRKEAQAHTDHTPCSPSSKVVLLWWATLLSFVGASLGWRYFKGYYLQLLPSLIWLALTPLSLELKPHLKRLKELSTPARQLTMKPALTILTSLSLSVSALLTLPHDLKESLEARERRARPLYLPTHEVARLSAWLNAHKQPNDTLWVWGRWGWPLYTHTELPSPTRFYKSLGVLTTQLTNTWNPQRRSAPVRFNPKGPWRAAIEELEATPPRFIVLARNEDVRGFTALHDLLKRSYKRVPESELKLARPKARLFQVYERAR